MATTVKMKSSYEPLDQRGEKPHVKSSAGQRERGARCVHSSFGGSGLTAALHREALGRYTC